MAASLPAKATVMVEISVEDLTREAHAIIHGTVARRGTRTLARGAALDTATLVWIRPRRWLKGRGGRTVLLREAGGVGALAASAVVGTPRYEVGEEVVVFVEVHGGRARTASMAQGKFEVVRGAPADAPRVRRDLTGLGFARFGSQGMWVAPAPADRGMRLSELLERIGRAQAYGGVPGAVLEEAP
jgi:hypothetical protein